MMKKRRLIKNLRDVVEKIKSHNIDDLAPLLPEINFNKFKKVGEGYFFLKCPFHKEKTPSFVYSPHKQIIYCFACKTSGDIIEFYVKMRKKGFYPAIIRLAKFFKIKLDWQNTYYQDEEDYQDYKERYLKKICFDSNSLSGKIIDDDDIPF